MSPAGSTIQTSPPHGLVPPGVASPSSTVGTDTATRPPTSPVGPRRRVGPWYTSTRPGPLTRCVPSSPSGRRGGRAIGARCGRVSVDPSPSRVLWSLPELRHMSSGGQRYTHSMRMTTPRGTGNPRNPPGGYLHRIFSSNPYRVTEDSPGFISRCLRTFRDSGRDWDRPPFTPLVSGGEGTT